MSRHAATAAHPTGPSIWAKPRVAGPARHSTGAHVHEFRVVAEFAGIRAGITQCQGELADGSVCNETRTLWQPWAVQA